MNIAQIRCGLFALLMLTLGAPGFASTQVNLSSSFDRAGMYSDGQTFTGGLDGNGNAYSATLLGSSQTWNGTSFNLGPANALDVVAAAGQAITLPSGQFSALRMLAASVNGSSTSQTFIVTYTDGTTSTFTQSVSNWYSSQGYSGESIANAMAYHNTHTGGSSNAVNLYGYSFGLNSSKTVASVTLPNNSHVVVVAMALVGSAATPTFSPATGTYTSSQTVTISDSTPGATIYYTTNGSTPTTSSIQYTGPVTVSSSETVEAIAVASGYAQSAAGSAAYNISISSTANWCTVPNSNPTGNCGPYFTYDVTGATGGNVNVQQDFWNQANAPSGSTQTLYALSAENWYVDASFPTGNTAVETYPDSDAIYTASNPLVSSYSYLYSGYASNMNANANTSAEAAYDILLNGGAANSEVMIWTDRSNRSLSGCTSLATDVSFGGSYGVPVQKWDLCRYGSTEMVWSLDQASLGTGTPTVYGVPAGSVDIYAMLMWLENNGYLASSTYLSQIEYGFEIASTGGVTEEFQVTGFTISASHP